MASRLACLVASGIAGAALALGQAGVSGPSLRVLASPATSSVPDSMTRPGGDARQAEEMRLRAQALVEDDRVRDARDLLDGAIRRMEGAGAPGEEELGRLLAERGDLARRCGRPAEAMAFFERARRLQEARWGPEHLEVTACLLGVGRVLDERGDFARAESLLARCLATRERVAGPDDPGVAEALAAWGDHLCLRADYAAAAAAYRRALEIRVARFGESDAEAAATMTSLGIALKILGQDAESVSLLRRAVEITEQLQGPRHTRTAAAYEGMAHALLGRSSAAEAESLFQHALDIVEAVYEPPHPLAAELRCDIGMCREFSGRADEARRYYEEGVAEAAEVFGPDSYEAALNRRHIGLLLVRQGRETEAVAVLERCLGSLEAQFGPHHPYLCLCLKGLVDATLHLGQADQARDYARRALATYEQASGKGHTEVAVVLGKSAQAELIAERWDAAVALAIRAVEEALAAQEDVYQACSEHEVTQYSAFARNMTGQLLAFVQLAPDLAPETLARAFSAVARAHGHVRDRMAQRRQLLALAGDSTEVGALYRDYEAATRRLANLAGGRPRENEAAHDERVAEARRGKERAERALSAASERFRALHQAEVTGRAVSTEALARDLAAGSGLIQFVRFRRFELVRLTDAGIPPRYTVRFAPAEADPWEYAAWCLWKGRSGDWELRFTPLGGTGPIDSLIAAYQRSVTEVLARGGATARDEGEYRALSRELYRRLWAPLEAGRPPAGTAAAEEPRPILFVVPEDRLHFVDLNTLLTPPGELLIERERLHTLSSARDLLRPALSRCGTGLLAVGNPSTLRERPETRSPAADSGGHRAKRPCPQSLDALGPLPGAEAEVRDVSVLYAQATGEPVTVLCGPDATEAAAKPLLAGKRFLHLATHGFFCEPSEGLDLDPRQGETDPLLLSGLIMAPGGAEEDGLLTAQELVAYDLRGVEWVILDACSSARGRLLLREGIFGFCRAFEIAGARTVISARWTIRDDVARDLIERLYHHRLGGAATVDAMRLAQLERLGAVRERWHRIHPALWAGLVAEGDWR